MSQTACHCSVVSNCLLVILLLPLRVRFWGDLALGMTRSVGKSEWHPASWQSRTAAQQPSYPDKAALERTIADLSRLPPIVTSWEVEALKEQIARAQRGDCLLYTSDAADE